MAVRTKELIQASKEARDKGKASTRCAMDCCIADVPLPGVSLLALSHDDSVLAACTDSEIHYFSLASLLTHKVIRFSPLSTQFVRAWISVLVSAAAHVLCGLLLLQLISFSFCLSCNNNLCSLMAWSYPYMFLSDY